MKTKKIASCRPQARRLKPYQPLFLAALYLGSLSASQATDGTWINVASGGLWSDPANWNNMIVADGSGATADFSTLNIGAASTVIFDAPRTLGGLLFGDTATTVYNWTLNNNGDPANVLTLDGPAPFITVNNGSFTNDVVTTGTLGVIVNGGTAASSLVLAQANTFTGDVTVNAGTGGNLTLFVRNAGGLGGSAVASNSIVLVGNTSTRALLSLATPGASYPAHNNLVMRPSGASTSSRAELRSVNGNATWNGTISLDGWSGSTSPRCDIYNDAGSSTLTINGNILDLNAYIGQMSLRGANPGIINGGINVPGATVAKDDGGTWTINSETNVWGKTAVLAGTLRLGRENALPATTTLTVGGGSATAVLDLNGFNQIISGLTSGGSNTKRITNSVGAATLIVSNAYDFSYSGSILGNITLTKESFGKLTLSGASTYTGDTIISNGTLAVTSSSAHGLHLLQRA
jgi:autotransporter-associated beta strand protein